MSETSTWKDRFRSVLQSLLSECTATSHGSPALSNAEYRQLVQNAEHDFSAAARLNQYVVHFSCLDTKTDAIELIGSHPALAVLLSEKSQEYRISISTLMSGRTFRKDNFFSESVVRLVDCAIRYGVDTALQYFDQYLELDSQMQLPGFEATFIVGLNLGEPWTIDDGLQLVPYKRFEEHLRPNVRWSFRRSLPPCEDPDRPIAVLMRDLAWGPSIAGKWHPPTPRYRFQLNPVLLTNFVAVMIARPFSVVGQCKQANKWIYDVAGDWLDTGMTYPTHHTGWQNSIMTTELSPEQKSEIAKWILSLKNIHSGSTDSIELALSRLAASLSRRGMLSEQDKILDIAIALEILYGLEGPELTEKISARTGWFIGKDGQDRLMIKETIRKFYNRRSNIVHGRNVGKDMTLFNQAFDFARKSTLNILAQGRIPSSKMWTKIVMGANSDRCNL